MNDDCDPLYTLEEARVLVACELEAEAERLSSEGLEAATAGDMQTSKAITVGELWRAVAWIRGMGE